MEKRTFSEKFDAFMMKDNTFILLVMGAAASIFAGTYLFVKFGTGAFNEISIVAMLTDGMSSGDYAAAAGFAAGFLIARILEGPLVGLMDIGGSLMTGVGIGIPAVFLSMGWKFPFSNFFAALLVGAVIGIVIGVVLIIIRKVVPEGMTVGGTSIMMGAGNAVGRYLAPLIVVAATQYNVFAGIGAIVGAAIFYKWGKEMTGGAILGAMILGAIFL
ncbi:DUF4310 family protein [Clostridium sp. KNHs216]|jgi:conserved hypothetical protein EF_0833/AHA_3914|uniref:DUF4310 family protein n=1 Tax=Clostridium sp. KNHs216 TaxID=1550235 RepID=UPI0005A983C3|nr:DUF4310 family protein [Clostridium sp. KNHs216]MBE6831616.1 DUF4310 family protein [Oscillospiraceae bacterium]TQI68497.1 uncharacterized protein (TIGR03579 family) [Clostridium sp. KNHs216]